jgi:hypothetical protein
MTDLVFLVERVAVGLYLICGAGALFWLSRWIGARREFAIAEFDLERELAGRRQANATTWLIAIAEFVLAVYAIANVIAPTLRQDLLTGSGGLVIGSGDSSQVFATSTPGGSGAEVQDMMLTVTAQVLSESGGIRLLTTAVPSATPVGTIVPGQPTPIGCNTAEAALEVPANGQVLFDSVEVRGTANVANFSAYKFELRGPSTGNQFAPVGGDKTSPVREKGVLGQIALNPFQPGQYQFRLAVFDNTGTLRASCTVNVTIRERPPPPTPPGS